MRSRDAGNSSAAQCADQMHFIPRAQRLIERLYFTLIDEDTDMRADAILFVDHAKAHARMIALEIAEQLSNSLTGHRYPGGARCVGT